MKRILAMRFSAFGDVAMTVPVVREFLEQNPGVRITFASHHGLASLFEGIDRVDFFPVDFHGRHRGIPGLIRLHRELMKKGPFGAVVDLHSVIRSHFLRTLFQARGLPTYKIHKNRDARHTLTRQEDKIKEPMRSIPERYADTFREAGFPITLSNTLRKIPRALSPETLETIGLSPRSKKPWIGIAPFSWYEGKTYPEDQMFHVVKELAESGECSVILFGGRGEEARKLEAWKEKLPGTSVAAGKLTLSQELDLISHLSVMVSMDSANMHLASLVGTRAVSVWGATHPYAGFLGYGQSPEDVVSVEMDCRPCSVFGNKPCFKGTYECMKSIPCSSFSRTVRRAAGIL